MVRLSDSEDAGLNNARDRRMARRTKDSEEDLEDINSPVGVLATAENVAMSYAP
jgi:hypothetical protein